MKLFIEILLAPQIIFFLISGITDFKKKKYQSGTTNILASLVALVTFLLALYEKLHTTTIIYIWIILLIAWAIMDVKTWNRM